MNLVIHLEVLGGESVLACEGKSIEDTLAFAKDAVTKNPQRAQCNLTTTKNGEGRAFARIAKTPHDSFLLLKDAVAWLNENK